MTPQSVQEGFPNKLGIKIVELQAFQSEYTTWCEESVVPEEGPLLDQAIEKHKAECAKRTHYVCNQIMTSINGNSKCTADSLADERIGYWAVVKK